MCECAPENDAPLRELKSVAATSKSSCELIENATTKLTHSVQPIRIYNDEKKNLKKKSKFVNDVFLLLAGCLPPQPLY